MQNQVFCRHLLAAMVIVLWSMTVCPIIADQPAPPADGSPPAPAIVAALEFNALGVNPDKMGMNA